MGAATKRKSDLKVALISAFVDIPTKVEIDRIANMEDCSISRILRLAVDEFIERRKKEAVA